MQGQGEGEVPTSSHTRSRLVSVFIFMYGQLAHPPDVEHPSPLAGPGTICSCCMTSLSLPSVSADAIESRDTGNTTCSPPYSCL